MVFTISNFNTILERYWPSWCRTNNVKELKLINHYSTPNSGAHCCDEHVGVYLSVVIFGTTCLIFTNFLVHVTYGRGLILRWQHSDTLCTSGFMDDVIFAHKPRLLDVAAHLECSAHAALSLAIKCAQ